MEDVYRKLQKHFDNAPVGYPETKSGVELKLLKDLFTEKEAGIALNLSIIPETVNKIHKRFRKGEISASELEDNLERMAKKGTIMRSIKSKKDPVKVYSRIPLAFGMFEFQVNRIDKETAKDFYDYLDEAFAEEFTSTPTKQMRTIPLNVKIDPEFHVGNYDNISELIKQSPGPFAVQNCICRQAKDKLEEPCKQTHTRETCLALGRAAKHVIRAGNARELTRQEVKKMLTRAKKEGMVLQPENNQDPNYICFCCGCCCGILLGAKKFQKPVEFLHTNFYADILAEQCDACEDCQQICQMEAIDRVNGYMAINQDRCIGCGLCVPVCPNKAISLLKKEKEFKPPRNTDAMYKKITYEKLGLLGTLKFAAKATIGKKL